MEGGDGCGEHLFSLELLVESARVQPRLLPTLLPDSGPFLSAVALRLLDFPTLLVHAPQAASWPVVPFGRGKSCLFRLRPDALKGLLRRSPLHALLLALPPHTGPARLLGSSSISLAAAAEELLPGSGPAAGRGHFPVRDLMGEPVGELELSYRLSSLGSSGLDHFEQGAAAAVDEALAGDQQLPCPQGRVAERRLSLEFISEGEEDPAPGGGSQGSLSSPDTEPEPFSGSSSGEDIAGKLDDNAFCPPPMYYSHQMENCFPSPKAATRVIIMAAQDSLPKEGTPLPFVKGESVVSAEKALPPLLANTPGTSEQLRQTLSQLPLLNALLVELSLLNSQPLPPGPSTVHPQLAWLYQNAEEGTKTLPCNGKNLCACWDDKKNTPHHKERGRSPSPKLKRNRPDHLKGMSPNCPGKTFTKPIYTERPVSPEKVNTKENSPTRRKFSYGLTNTLKLRVQRSSPGMLKVHEKREHRRKKLGDISFEKKGKSSLTKEKIFRGSLDYHPKSSGQYDEKSISDQNAQINENVETLIQSSIGRNSHMTTKKISSRITKKIGASCVKNKDNAKGKYSSESVGSNCKEKSLEVHLPRVFLQDTEALENPVDAQIEKCLQCDRNIPYIYKDRHTNNLEKNCARKNSDSVVVTSENTAYSEDFTSIDSCGTSLEAPEYSPEPLSINSDHSQSGIDSSSKNSRSLPAKCISPLLPKVSAISPVQTLKKTYDLKSNKNKLGIGLKKMDDDSLARTLRDQLTIKEKEKVTQIFEDQQVQPNTNCNLAKSQSYVENSHSARTSQVSSYLPSSVSDLEFSGLEESKAPDNEQEDSFGKMNNTNQCKHISELVINKLPGYTM
ncbi:microtubule-associated protein 10 [Protobothrops mucrosquamatus]|uniref:microtubule-associated protein 10 n=1 Tax=Protobothrops mucrosquamatus TaxID=103944 RepID=UPI000775C571|nr:microtubule-associated protein 10 [Protobothrops mucrosquamatus]